jgi:hypothetical protein
MTGFIFTAMEREICESADVASRIVRNAMPSLKLQDAWISAPRRFVSCAAAEARSCRRLPPLPYRNEASPASVRQRSLGDHGIAQAADALDALFIVIRNRVGASI